MVNTVAATKTTTSCTNNVRNTRQHLFIHVCTCACCRNRNNGLYHNAISIKASGGLDDNEIEDMIKDAETYAEEDKARREEVEARNRAEALLHTAEKTMSDLGDKADDAVKAEVESGVAELKTALEGNDAADIAAKAETLSAAMMKMGEAAYQAEPEAGEAEAGNTASDGANDGDDVVDAEFEEVEDDQDAKKA